MRCSNTAPTLPCQVPAPPGLPFRLRCAGAPARKLRLLRGQAFADPSDGAEDGLVQLGEDVEATDLMVHRAEDLGNRPRIQVRTVGGDPVELQPAAGEGLLEPPEEGSDIAVSRGMVEDLVTQPLEGAGVDERQDAERPVVKLLGSDRARGGGAGPM